MGMRCRLRRTDVEKAPSHWDTLLARGLAQVDK
jgi:hypothetical protein